MAGAPVGNKNAARGKHWRDALKAELATFEDKKLKVKRGLALRRIARQVIRDAICGEMDAIREIGNRLDGKPVQSTEVTLEVNARMVLVSYVARLGVDGTRELLQRAAPHLLPLLETMKPELPVIEHGEDDES